MSSQSSWLHFSGQKGSKVSSQGLWKGERRRLRRQGGNIQQKYDLDADVDDDVDDDVDADVDDGYDDLDDDYWRGQRRHGGNIQQKYAFAASSSSSSSSSISSS